MRGVTATMRAAFAEARANRAALWSQMAIMIVNDCVWVLFWVLFFRAVGTMRGWDTHGVLLLQAALTTAGGAVLGLFSNARRIGALAGGDLDAVLALPVATLPAVLVRRVDAVNLGDLVFGVTLFFVVGHPTPVHLAVFLLGAVAATLVLGGFLVIVGSTAFFGGRGEAGDVGFHAMLLLSAYPADIFTGAGRLVLYTVVPAAFVAAVPARLVERPRPAELAALVAAATVFALGGWLAFSLGLRRYTSSSGWTRA